MTKTDARREARLRLSSADTSVYRTVGIEPEQGRYLPDTTRTLCAFLPHGSEPDIIPLISRALDSGIIVSAPIVIGTEMEFRRITNIDGPFRTGAFGIREPFPDAELVFPKPSGSGPPDFPAVILVPGLAFTRTGDRLGKGGGYYDRFLARFLASFPDRRQDVTLAGICLTSQIVDELPVEPHDIPVDCLYTEKGIILCTAQ